MTIKKTKPHVSLGVGNNEWYTPSLYIEKARIVMGGIDLDPASCPLAQETVQAKHIFSLEDDGLSHSWLGKVWMNPPYGRDLIGKFMLKMANEFSCGHVSSAIVLVNNATDTKWFNILSEHASSLCLVKKRIRFHDGKQIKKTPLQGQIFLYLGKDSQLFHNEFSTIGSCWHK